MEVWYSYLRDGEQLELRVTIFKQRSR